MQFSSLPLGRLGLMVLLAFACNAAFTQTFGMSTPFWLMNAVVVVVLLRQPTRSWPAWLAASTVGDAIACSLYEGGFILLALPDTLEIALVAWLLRRFIFERQGELHLSRQAAGFVLICLLVPVLGSAAGAALIKWHAGGSFPFIWWDWYPGSALGLVLVTPLLLSWLDPQMRRQSSVRLTAPRVAQLLVLAALAAALVVQSWYVPLLLLVFPVLLVMGWGFGLPGATLGVAMVSAVALVATPHGMGAVFQLLPEGASASERLRAVQFFMAAAMFSTSPLAVLLMELRRHKAMLDALIDAVPDRVVYKDVHRVYMGVNRAAAEGLGLRPGEVAGRTAEQIMDPELAATVRVADEKLLRTRQPVREENWMRGPDGERILLEMRKAPLLDDDGQLIGIMGIGRDITRQRAAEDEIRRAKELAEEATRMKSTFLANMSHEIRTPMNAVIGLADLVLKTPLEARQRDFVQKIHSAGLHLVGILNDILDFSKIESGKMDIERAPFALADLLVTVAHMVGHKCSAKGLELVFDVEPEVPLQLVGDSLRLGQILVNLANNAVKFTERGEVVITVGMQGEVDGRPRLRIAVRDSGIGMDAAQRGRLFESFQQADATVSRRYGGTGLGLAISRELATLMGGEIGVQSEPGQGSVFWFTAVLDVHADAARPAAALAGRSALLVEDHPAARSAMERALADAGLQTLAVGSGAEALEAMLGTDGTTRSFDLVLVDSTLADMEGGVVAQCILGMGLHPQPVVALLAPDTAADRSQTSLSAGVGVLPKPLPPAALVERVSALLQRSAAAGPIAPIPGAPDAQHAASGARVLLVEDNDINQIIATELLQSCGAEVVVADNGAIGVSLVQSGTFDLVLMDMQMPVMDGVTATREIRKLPGLAGLPIVALTANAMTHDRQLCLDAGMDDFLAKPIDPTELERALLRWTRGAERRRGAELGSPA